MAKILYPVTLTFRSANGWNDRMIVPRDITASDRLTAIMGEMSKAWVWERTENDYVLRRPDRLRHRS